MKHPYLARLVYLVALQFVANATILIIDPYGSTIASFANTEATTIDEDLKGYIESSNPSNACSNVAFPTIPTNLGMKKFVLINGTSKCDFITKIQNVAAVGFDVAIVYNPFPELFQYNITIPFPKSEVNLSVVIILYEDGLLIKNNYLYHNLSGKDETIIEIVPNATWKSYLLILLVGCLAFVTPIAVVFLLCAASMKIIDCWFRNNDEHPHGTEEIREHPHGTEEIREHLHGIENRLARIIAEGYRRAEDNQNRRLLKSLNKKFPLVQFAADDKFNTCTICITPFEVRENIRVLKCGHAYHTDCIDPWLLQNTRHTEMKKICPLCNKKINWESSLDESNLSVTESTPLLGSSCPGYVSISGNYSGDHLARAQGSVNQCPWIASDEDNNV